MSFSKLSKEQKKRKTMHVVSLFIEFLDAGSNPASSKKNKFSLYNSLNIEF